MDMFFSAKRQTLAQFMEVYDRQRLNEVHGGSPVIFDAMANQSPQDRYEIVKFLVGEGAELKYVILDKDVTVTPGAKLIGTKKSPVIVKRGETV